MAKIPLQMPDTSVNLVDGGAVYFPPDHDFQVTEGGALRVFDGDEQVVAAFPPQGWLGAFRHGAVVGYAAKEDREPPVIREEEG